jgi:hypothetical protein
MTGNEYADLVAAYILQNFDDQGLQVYREINIGKSIIGKGRRIDLLVVDEKGGTAFAIECKYQATVGTVDEKIPYALDDMDALRVEGCIVYAGAGFSTGVLHLLQASETAAYCLPHCESLARTKDTKELDHMLATHFGWWDLLVAHREPFDLEDWKAGRIMPDEQIDG